MFLPNNSFLFTTGDGFEYREDAQRLDSLIGKTVRLNDDVSVLADNPFLGHKEVRPEIYSCGHRNPQGLVQDSRTKKIYLNEHGPRGGDEVNVVEAGANYGWPTATYDIDYSGAKVSPFTEYDRHERHATAEYDIPARSR